MADVKIVDIDGSQWNMKDQEARAKIAELETLVNKLKTDTEVTELNDIILGYGVRFIGTVIKVGKKVTVSGNINVQEGFDSHVIKNLPINKSMSNKDSIIVWTNTNAQYLGTSYASFDKGLTEVSITIGSPSSYPATGQLCFSYVTE